MSRPEPDIVVKVDGSFSARGAPAGWGAVVRRRDGTVTEHRGPAEATRSHEAEWIAVREGVRLGLAAAADGELVEVRTDCLAVADSAGRLLPGRRGRPYAGGGMGLDWRRLVAVAAEVAAAVASGRVRVRRVNDVRAAHRLANLARREAEAARHDPDSQA